MKSKRSCVFVIGIAALSIGIYAETASNRERIPAKTDDASIAVQRGVKWLVSVQGKDGGWGQDGGETSYVRQGERLESTGNDVANTAVATQALLHSGYTTSGVEYRQSFERAVRFILQRVEQSPVEGLAVTDRNGTQIQRKLGPFIDTFLSSRLLAELDGNMGDALTNARVRRSLEKCVAKIEKNQLKDGSWNIAGGWAPILGTSMASQSLYLARTKGVAVPQKTMDQVEVYTARTYAPPDARGSAGGAGYGAGAGGGVMGGIVAGVPSAAPSARMEASAASAGVSLYKRAQELEQLSRTDKDRQKNAPQIAAIKTQLADTRFVTGFGSMGGEEFFSYLNISDSLHRAGGPEWDKWNGDIKTKLVKLQNGDGTWAGHHCITGRVAVTSAAILTLVADQEPVQIAKKAPRK